MVAFAPTEPQLGPNSARVNVLLDRAAALTEAEGMALLHANRRLVVGRDYLPVALREIVHATHAFGRQEFASRAEQAGRRAVRIFPGSAFGGGLAGIVARVAETLVVADVIAPSTLTFMLQPWRETIGDA